ncbi:ribonuclease HI [Phyllobacterium sp. CCNWLW109]|uniref:ribonuclease HI n=1 Tax=Phyllobacterium sp. CCNWLW109 TaxID=3127479 RepID=UPI0030777039
MDTDNTFKGRHIIIHTDGACIRNPGPGGWGAILQSMDGNIELKRKEISGYDSDSTNNRMEMTAAIKALEALKDNANPVHIRSDSNLLIRGMNEWLPGWKTKGWKNAGGKSVANQDLWEFLDRLSTPRIHWSWVRGHAGNKLNEMVDRLATAAARSPENRLFTA